MLKFQIQETMLVGLMVAVNLFDFVIINDGNKIVAGFFLCQFLKFKKSCLIFACSALLFQLTK